LDHLPSLQPAACAGGSAVGHDAATQLLLVELRKELQGKEPALGFTTGSNCLRLSWKDVSL